MKFGCVLGFQTFESISELVRQGLLLEKFDFDSIWLPDHLITIYPEAVCPDVWGILTYLGARTKRIKLSPGVTDPLRRHPATIAQTVATFDRLTMGRAMLGIGTGEAMNLKPFGIKWDKPVKRMREAIECIKLLWDSSPQKTVSYEGQFYSLYEAFLQVQPLQSPHPPLYIGAMGPQMRKITGKIADGWYPWLSPLTLYAEWLRDLKEGTKEGGRSFDEIDTVARAYVAMSNDYEKAKRAVEKTAKTALVLEKRTLQQLGYELPSTFKESIHDMVPDRDYEEFHMKLQQALNEVPTQAIQEVSILGSPDDCIHQIEQYVQAGATHLVIYNLSPDKEKTIEIFGKRIIPYFNGNA